MTKQTDSAIDAALELAPQGIACFPVRLVHLPNGDVRKLPATPHGFKDASTDPAILRTLWRDHPGPLVGVATGTINGIDVLDIDQKPEARQWWQDNRHRIPKTRTHRTRSGGLHLLFEHASGVRSSAGRISLGVDVRSDGGCIIWWPAAGFPVLSDAPIAPWPQWLLAQALPPKPPEISSAAIVSDDKVNRGILAVVAHAREGERNRVLFWAACRTRRIDLGSRRRHRTADRRRRTGRPAARRGPRHHQLGLSPPRARSLIMPHQAKPDFKIVPPPEKPDLRCHSDYAAVATATLNYLRENADLYRYGGRLAFIKRDDEDRPTIRVADVHDIRMIVADYVQPFKLDKDGSRKDIALPIDIAQLMLAAFNDIAAFRPIVGVTTAPLLREDGSICIADGYDAESGLFCDYTNLPALDIPEHPTEADAKASLKAIRQVFVESPFADRVADRENEQATGLEQHPGDDESAFLNQLMLGVCRASMELAPGLIVRAADGNGGAGKTTLARAIATIAFGYEPKDSPFGEDMTEFGKTLLSELRTGPASVLFDNGNNLTLRSNLLNLVLTSGRAQGRVLGSSEMADLQTRALILMTGNALGVSADDIRRVLVSNLDARTEDPERRPVTNAEFIRDVIKPRRAELLRHLLTIWRWGRQHPEEIAKGEALVSFGQYCRWVRDPLRALDCKDPVARIDELKQTDPKREHQATVFRKWWKVHDKKPNNKLQTKPVTAFGLGAEVCALIDPNYGGNNRAKVISDLASWRGVRVGGFVLEHNAAKKGKWSPTQYRLSRQQELKDDDEASEASQRNSTDHAERAGSDEASPGSGRFRFFATHDDDVCEHCERGREAGTVYRVCRWNEVEHHLLHEGCADAFYAREEEIADGWASAYEDDGDAG
jgi:hypothetical protein